MTNLLGKQSGVQHPAMTGLRPSVTHIILAVCDLLPALRPKKFFDRLMHFLLVPLQAEQESAFYVDQFAPRLSTRLCTQLTTKTSNAR